MKGQPQIEQYRGARQRLREREGEGGGVCSGWLTLGEADLRSEPHEGRQIPIGACQAPSSI